MLNLSKFYVKQTTNLKILCFCGDLSIDKFFLRGIIFSSLGKLSGLQQRRKLGKAKQMNLNYNYVLAYATEKHAGQFRADGVTPYIEHPKLVAEIMQYYVEKFGKDEDKSTLPMLVAAALLHDTVEDTYVSYRELKELFGDTVAGLVMDVSTVDYDKNEKGKDRYLAEKLTTVSDYALFLKLADRLANVLDSEQLNLARKFKLRKGTENILKFVEDKRGRYFTELLNEILNDLWDALNTKIPYKIFMGTEFESQVFDATTYHNPNF